MKKSVNRYIQLQAAVLVLLVALTAATEPAQAKKSLLSVLFPYIFQAEEEEEAVVKPLKAGDTAPFAQQQAGNDQTARMASAVSLDKPHRLPVDIETWLTRQVSNILNIAPQNYEEHLKAIQPVMSDGGLAEFQLFVQKSQTLETLQANKLNLTAYVEQAPILLNEAVLKGRYRWLYDVPMALTFVPQGAQSYQGFDPVNQYMILRVQVGRIAPGTNEEDLQIETFEVRDNPDK